MGPINIKTGLQLLDPSSLVVNSPFYLFCGCGFSLCVVNLISGMFNGLVVEWVFLLPLVGGEVIGRSSGFTLAL